METVPSVTQSSTAEPPLDPALIQPRSVFVSDVHLGCKYAQTEAFLGFLQRYHPDYLYLVGDIFDGWRLKKTWHWRESYTGVMQRLFDLGQNGTKVFYTPGNHDEFLREFLSFNSLGDIRIANEFVHETADGKRLLVTHGDQFDKVTSNHKWLSRLGDVGYNLLMGANRFTNTALSWIRRPPVHFSKKVKERVKKITNSMSDFETTLAKYAASHRCQGVVCGHIHIPTAIERPDGISYYNTGDWVENRSALVELPDGKLHMLDHVA